MYVNKKIKKTQKKHKKNKKTYKLSIITIYENRTSNSKI